MFDAPGTRHTKESPNLFISKLGFDRHLDTLSFTQILQLTKPRQHVQVWIPAFTKIMRKVNNYAAAMKTGPIAMVLKRRTTTPAPSGPLTTIEDETLRTYIRELIAGCILEGCKSQGIVALC